MNMRHQAGTTNASAGWNAEIVAGLHYLALICVALLAWAAPAAACTVTEPPNADLGSFSPTALKDSAVAQIGKSGGIDCSGTVISLLGGNTLTATISTPTSFKLTSPGKPDGGFQVFPSATSTTAFRAGTAVNFLDPQVIDLLGLLGNSPASIPLYIKPSSTDLLLPGTYTGSFNVTWTWKFCSIAWVAGRCTLGTPSVGTKSININFSMTVVLKPFTAQISTITTWDPYAGTTNPKAIIGAKKRMTVTVTNPDVIASDLDTVQIEISTPAGMLIALDGDGASIGKAIKFADGTPASTLAFSYVGPGDGFDDVDFYADGVGWAYVPTPGDPTSQAMVKKVRLKPRGKFAPGASFSMTLPYLVK